MRYKKGSPGDQLKGIRKTIEEALGKLKNPTPEMAEKAVKDLLPSSSDDAGALVPFTGYYSLSTAAGAFLVIDSKVVYINRQITEKIVISLSYPIITISVSLDGKTCNSYPFDSSASFDGQTLTIPGVLQVSFARGYQGGQLVTLSGTIGGKTVSGSTYFNPVKLPVFVGTYKDVQTKQDKLAVAESSLMFNFGDGLQRIELFQYDPAMFVVQFEATAGMYTLMLGTAPNGLVCFITYGESNDFAEVIPQ